MPVYRMRYMNDAIYLSADKTTDVAKRSHSRQNNVSVVYILSPENRSELQLFGIIAIEAMKNIDRGEEIFASYGNEYRFFKGRPNTGNQ